MGSVYLGPRCQRVGTRTQRTGDFANLDAPRQQGVCNQRAMAAPRNSLGAHQYDPLVACERDASIQAVLEGASLHVVRIAAKAGIPPPRVRRVPSGVASSAQSSHVTVCDPRARQRRRQSILSELWVVARARDRPHVDQVLDVVSLQQVYEIIDRPGGMTDGEDGERPHVSVPA